MKYCVNVNLVSLDSYRHPHSSPYAEGCNSFMAVGSLQGMEQRYQHTTTCQIKQHVFSKTVSIQNFSRVNTYFYNSISSQLLNNLMKILLPILEISGLLNLIREFHCNTYIFIELIYVLTGSTNRVPQSHSSSLNVDLLGVNSKFPDDGQRLDCESLVQLKQIHFIQTPTSLGCLETDIKYAHKFKYHHFFILKVLKI